MFFHSETAATSIILHNGELQQQNPAKAIFLQGGGVWKEAVL